MQVRRIVFRAGVVSLVAFSLLLFGSVTYAGTRCSKKAKRASTDASGGSAKACSKSASKTSCEGKSGPCCGKKGTRASSESIREIASDIPYHEYKRLVLQGKYVCAKCDLKKISSCQGFIKTAEGKLYPLLKNSHIKEMKRIMHCGGSTEFKITSFVRLLDGVKYLEVKNFKRL